MQNNTATIYEKLSTDLKIKNKFATPKITKVVLNIGTGASKINPKFVQVASKTLESITGQKPAERMAKKAIAGFKIRAGEKVGLMVTLRGKRMNDFLAKLTNIVLPRTRDFRGLDIKGFDKQGNYTLAIPEQIVFSEITHEKAELLHGVAISIVTTAKDSVQGKYLLMAWGFPFKKGQENG